MSTVVSLAVPSAFGYLVGGWLGLAVAFAAAATLRDGRRRVQLSVATVSVGLIAVSAVATALEGSRDVVAKFATERPVAAWSARTAGVLLFAILVSAALREREPQSGGQLPG